MAYMCSQEKGSERFGKPLPPDVFFSREHLGEWLPEDQILARFPNLAEVDEETYKLFYQFDPVNQFFIMAVAWDKASMWKIPGPNVPPYHLFCGFYGRYMPGRVYVSTTKDGAQMLSSQFHDPKVVELGEEGLVKYKNVECCGNRHACPNMSRHAQMVLEGQLPSLNLCSRCKIVSTAAASVSGRTGRSIRPCAIRLIREANPA